MKPSWYRIRNEAATPTVAEVDIFDTIGWETTATDFIAELRSLDVTQIQLNVNSPGGDVFDGLAILNALRQHPATITGNVMGVAASAASFIVVGGCDTVNMAPNSTMMIHPASGFAIGNADDMRQTADLLDLIDRNIATIYAAKAGGTVDDWLAVMRADTWYVAEDAVKAGLADAVKQAKTTPAASGGTACSDGCGAGCDGCGAGNGCAANCPGCGPDCPGCCSDCGGSSGPKNQIARTLADVQRAAALSSDIARAVSAHHLPAAPEPGLQETHQEEDSMSALFDGLRQRLGITDAALDETGLLTALDEALTERAEPQNHAPLPAGTVAIDEATLAQLTSDAAAGRDARAEQITNAREAAITAAITSGRIAPARAQHWRDQLIADPGAVEVLNSLAPVVPVDMIGHTGGTEETNDDDEFYASVYGKDA